jgi:ABC-type bacteriocin/lantibiotic exporter with double-glycine peptidase domain
MVPGEHVALVGATGSGKSTVARLATGLVEPWSGELLYDGYSRSQLSRDALVASLASVDQQVFLFSGTIRENLALWDESMSEETMIQAARDACLHEDIMKLPMAYEHRLVEDGRNLSAGQRQRLEIARALVTNPSLLILDEATSALDSLTEARLIENLRKRSCSCLIIAHRLSSIQHCDQILVLDRGRLVQRGTHGALKAVGGLYREFIRAEGQRHG